MLLEKSLSDVSLMQSRPSMFRYQEVFLINIRMYLSTICADVMFVSRVVILVTVSRSINYGTVHGLPSMKIPVMEAAIQGVVKSYAVRGFLIKFIFVYVQFKAIKDCNNIEGAIVNIVSRDEYDKDIERFI